LLESGGGERVNLRVRGLQCKQAHEGQGKKHKATH